MENAARFFDNKGNMNTKHGRAVHSSRPRTHTHTHAPKPTSSKILNSSIANQGAEQLVAPWRASSYNEDENNQSSSCSSRHAQLQFFSPEIKKKKKKLLQFAFPPFMATVAVDTAVLSDPQEEATMTDVTDTPDFKAHVVTSQGKLQMRFLLRHLSGQLKGP